MVSNSLYVTCVPPEQAHPSGRLAQQYGLTGFHVETLFVNARSPRCLWSDALRLSEVIKEENLRSVVINVNGSIAQAIVVGICRWRGARSTLWIMDSYPGCLRYVTRFWPLLYPFFFVGSVLAKMWANKVLVIDEAFSRHAPTWPGFRKKCFYVPLPQTPRAGHEGEFESVAGSTQRPTIGLIGNIEESWLRRDFDEFYRLARKCDYEIIVATSKAIDRTRIEVEGVRAFIPWRKAETDSVFAQCTAILVPLSGARLIYSSPSKIIDCYRRGILPVVMVDENQWNMCKHRKIYKMCVLYSDFFVSGNAASKDSLIAYSKLWDQEFLPASLG